MTDKLLREQHCPQRVMHHVVPMVLIISAIMTGCAGDDLNDVRDFVAQERARPGSKIPPLPTFETYVTVPYAAAHLRGPFTPLAEMGDVSSNTPVGDVGQPPIAMTHKPEALEKFPLDGLKFVGLLERNEQRWAIITSPDKLVHRVKLGNYLGQNYGRIVSITEMRIEVMETVSDGLGGWVERPAALNVVE